MHLINVFDNFYRLVIISYVSKLPITENRIEKLLYWFVFYCRFCLAISLKNDLFFSGHNALSQDYKFKFTR